MLPGQVDDTAVSHLLRLGSGGKRGQALPGPLVPDNDGGRAGQHVDRLREGDGRDPEEGHDPVDPPQGEVSIGSRRPSQASLAEPLAHEPAKGRPGLEGRIDLGDAEGLEEETGCPQEEERGEEHPVPHHVAGTVFLPVGPPVVQAGRTDDRPSRGQDAEAEEQGPAEQVEEERVAEVEVVPEEVEAEDRLGQIVLEGEDDRACEEHQEAVEDEGMGEAGKAIAPLDPGMRTDDPGCAPKPGKRPVDMPKGSSAPPVLGNEPGHAVGEDGQRHPDQAVPEDYLPGGKPGEGLASSGQKSFSSSSATSCRSATAP